jgi:energy-coupling factor transporter ATP-binding protein EcfA2
VKPLFTDLLIGLCDGDHVGLIGPNGRGESTLLKILVGLDEPDSSTRSVQRQVEWLRRGLKVCTTKAKAWIDSAGRLVDELLDMDRDIWFPGGQLFLSNLRAFLFGANWGLIKFTHDANGNVTSILDPQRNPSLFEYAPGGLVQSLTVQHA